MTATILKSDVVAFASELSSVADPAWFDILAYVNEFDLTQTGETEQTDRMAKIFLAAHMATMDKRAGSLAVGPVTSEAVGGVRRSYGLLATATTGSSSLASTRYGLLYLEVIGSSLAAGPLLV